MKKQSIVAGLLHLRKITWFVCASLLAPLVPMGADVVEMDDGSVIHGTIVRIDERIIEMDTDFAGALTVSRENVRSLSTDREIQVALDRGVLVIGRVELADGTVRVDTEDARFEREVDRLLGAWSPDDDSPEVRRLRAQLEEARRSWAYQANLNLSGRSGNTDSFSTALGFRAVLDGPEDRLVFFIDLDFDEQNNIKTSERVRGGVDYSADIVGLYSWYVRSELERDRIQGLDMRAMAAAGFGYRVIDQPSQWLMARAGLSYRYEDFDLDPSFDSIGLDTSLEHFFRYREWGTLRNLITYTPAFEDLGNYRIFHESSVEMPLGLSDFWALRVGISNDYRSRPQTGMEKLDTTYFTRLILTWD